MLAGADERLETKFDDDLSSRIEYVRFAIDHDVIDGTVRPGIGGNVYLHYGWEDAGAKNRTTPELVMSRRKLLAR